jgi:hypothetical protein
LPYSALLIKRIRLVNGIRLVRSFLLVLLQLFRCDIVTGLVCVRSGVIIRLTGCGVCLFVGRGCRSL